MEQGVLQGLSTGTLLIANGSDQTLQHRSTFSLDLQILGSTGGSACFGHVALHVGVELGLGDQAQEEVVAVLEVHMEPSGADCRASFQSRRVSCSSLVRAI